MKKVARMKQSTELNPGLRIGANCGFMNISGLYEKYETLFLALAYTSIDFLYNKKSFIEFINPKPAQDYISKENDLVIAGRIDSRFRADIKLYTTNLAEKIYLPQMVKIETGHPIDWHALKQTYLDRDTPIMLTFDHFYAFDDYRKGTAHRLQFHSPAHMVALHDIDFENDTAFIVDKFYNFSGEVQGTHFRQAVTSSHLSAREFFYVKMTDFGNLTEEEGFYEYFHKNFEAILEDEVTINDREYHKNIKAVQRFCADIEEIIASLYRQKGKYTPQFLSKLLAPAIWQKISFHNLLKYFIGQKDFNPAGEKHKLLKELWPVIQQSKTNWVTINLYNDKFYLQGIKLLDRIELYKKLLSNIAVIDSKIYSLIRQYQSLA